MKSILTLSLLALAASASAQITLNQASYGSWMPQTATAYRLDPNMTYPTLTSSTNASWDLSNVTYDTTNIRSYYEGPFSDPAFPNATFYDTITYPVGAALSYGVQEAGLLGANGFQFIGQKIPRQSFSLAPATGGANDSMTFPAQNITYSSPRTAIAFPATMGSSWNSNYSFTTNFNLTVAAYNLNNTPCQRKTMVSYTNNVIGWGTLRVKDSNGVATAPMNVLMVKTVMHQVDSFFLAGSPAPPQLLTPFGLSQGFKTDRYFYDFLRAGERMPLFSALYRDSTFSPLNVERMDVHVERLTPLGIASLDMQNGVKAYPNPVKGQTVNLEIEGHNGNLLSYTLMNMAGQVVGQGTLTPTAGAAQLKAEALATPGIYYLQLTKGSNPIAVLPLSVE